MSQQSTTHDQQNTTVATSASQAKSPQQLTEEEMRERYVEQQRRLACPGCGEEPFLGYPPASTDGVVG